MGAILQTTFSNAFSWTEMFEFRLKFHWSLFPGSNWQFSSVGSVNGLATDVKAIVWTNDGYQVYRRIYASPGLIGLTRLYWDWLSQFSPYAFIVFWIVLVYCMPQFYMGSNKDFLNLNWTVCHHWFRYWLEAEQGNVGLVCWRIRQSASFGLCDLTVILFFACCDAIAVQRYILSTAIKVLSLVLLLPTLNSWHA